MPQVRAKFQCYDVMFRETDGKKSSAIVKLNAVYGTGEENKSWSQATPNGSIELTITNMDAVASFQTGKYYFIDFTLSE